MATACDESMKIVSHLDEGMPNIDSNGYRTNEGNIHTQKPKKLNRLNGNVILFVCKIQLYSSQHSIFTFIQLTSLLMKETASQNSTKKF